MGCLAYMPAICLKMWFIFTIRFIYGLHPYEAIFVKTIWDEEYAKETARELQQVIFYISDESYRSTGLTQSCCKTCEIILRIILRQLYFRLRNQLLKGTPWLWKNCIQSLHPIYNISILKISWAGPITSRETVPASWCFTPTTRARAQLAICGFS